MSSFYKPSEYTPFQKETQWLNDIHQTHDLFCWCNDPWKHLMQCLLMRGNQFNLSAKDTRILQKCLISTKETGEDQEPTTEKTTTEEDNVLDLEDGELEKLFAEIEDTG